MERPSRPMLYRLTAILAAICTPEGHPLAEPQANCPQLARELEVHPRTILRDLDLLRDALELPIDYDPDRRTYYLTRPVGIDLRKLLVLATRRDEPLPALLPIDGLRVSLSRFAKAELFSTARAFHVRPEDLLATIAESYLDAASGDGALQAELAGAAAELRRTGRVPGCWMELEDHADDDSEPARTVEQIEEPGDVYRQTGGRVTTVRRHPEGWLELTEGWPLVMVEYMEPTHLSVRDQHDAAAKSQVLGQVLRVPPGDYRRPVAEDLNGRHFFLGFGAPVDESAAAFSLSAAAPEALKEEEATTARTGGPVPLRDVLTDLLAGWRIQAAEARALGQDVTPFSASHKLHGQADLLEACADALEAALG